MTEIPQAELHRLLARQTIRDVAERYCRGADRCDAALMKSCFHPDATDDHGFFNGPAHDFADLAAQRLAERFVSSKHFLSNMYLEWAGEDEARCESYMLTLSRQEREGALVDIWFSARYLDVFTLRGGAWRIASRVLVDDGRRVDALVDAGDTGARSTKGARGPADPSWDFFDPEDAESKT